MFSKGIKGKRAPRNHPGTDPDPTRRPRETCWEPDARRAAALSLAPCGRHCPAGGPPVPCLRQDPSFLPANMSRSSPTRQARPGCSVDKIPRRTLALCALRGSLQTRGGGGVRSANPT